MNRVQKFKDTIIELSSAELDVVIGGAGSVSVRETGTGSGINEAGSGSGVDEAVGGSGARDASSGTGTRDASSGTG